MITYGVTTDDVGVKRWRALTPDETSQAETLIIDACDQIEIKRPAVPATAVEPVDNDDRTRPAMIYRAARQLVIDAVQRVLRNPDVMDAQQIGADGSLGFQHRTDNELKTGQSGLRLQITDTDLALLDAAVYGPTIGVTGGRGGVYMMVMADPDPITV